MLVNFVFSSAVDTNHTVTTTVSGDQSERREGFLAGVVATNRTDGSIYKKVAVSCMQKKQCKTFFAVRQEMFPQLLQTPNSHVYFIYIGCPVLMIERYPYRDQKLAKPNAYFCTATTIIAAVTCRKPTYLYRVIHEKISIF